jgi:hypothetical protein
MSRSGYQDDLDPLDLGRWRGMVASASRGKRGQKFFRDLVAALDAMPEKRLVTTTLKNSEGEVCALGALCQSRGVEVPITEDESEFDASWTSRQLDIARCLVQEAVYENDEGSWDREIEERRWQRMRAWAENNIIPTKSGGPP